MLFPRTSSPLNSSGRMEGYSCPGARRDRRSTGFMRGRKFGAYPKNTTERQFNVKDFYFAIARDFYLSVDTSLLPLTQGD